MSNGLIMPELNKGMKIVERKIGTKHILTTTKFDGYGNILSTSIEKKRHDELINEFIKEHGLKDSQIVNIQTTDNYDSNIHLLINSTLITYLIDEKKEENK